MPRYVREPGIPAQRAATTLPNRPKTRFDNGKLIREGAQALFDSDHDWYVFVADVIIEPDGTKDVQPRQPWGGNSVNNMMDFNKLWGRHADQFKANLCIDCGRSGIIVIDCDSAEATEQAKVWGLTPTATTPRPGIEGFHAYYLADPDLKLKNSASKLHLGMDVRVSGGMVLAPPSWDDRGQRTWINGVPNRVEPMPTDLREAVVAATRASARPGRSVVTGNRRQFTRKQAAEYVEKHGLHPLRTGSNGERNNRANDAAVCLRHFIPAFYTLDEAKELLDDALAACAYEDDTKPLYALLEHQRDMQPDSDDFTAELVEVSVDANGLNDSANARRFVNAFIGRVRYSTASGWLIWDGSRWARDDVGQVQQWAKEVAYGIFDEAKACGDDTKATKLRTWANSSLNARGLGAMINLAQSEPEIRVRHSALDSHPDLIAAANGVVDLRTGRLLEADPDLLMTKASRLTYELGPRPQWDQFIKWVTKGDEDLARYLQVAAGRSLTGRKVEEIILLYSPLGGTGKGTFTTALEAVAGEYAQTVQPSTLEPRRGTNGHTDDIASLFGARIGLVGEAREGQSWDLSLVKQLSGGDSVSASRKGEQTFKFEAFIKMWVHTNHKPKIGGNDPALQRRLQLVRFRNQVTDSQRDDDYKHRLVREEGPAIFAWMVEGAVEWYRQGMRLVAPEAVRRESKRYFQEEDKFRWVEELFVFEEGAWVTNNELRPVFDRWQKDSGDYESKYNDFTAALQRKGELFEVDVESRKRANQRGYVGVRLADKAEQRINRRDGVQLRTVMDL